MIRLTSLGNYHRIVSSHVFHGGNMTTSAEGRTRALAERYSLSSDLQADIGKEITRAEDAARIQGAKLMQAYAAAKAIPCPEIASAIRALNAEDLMMAAQTTAEKSATATTG